LFGSELLAKRQQSIIGFGHNILSTTRNISTENLSITNTPPHPHTPTNSVPTHKQPVSMIRSKTTVSHSRRSKMDLQNDSFHSPRRDRSSVNASWAVTASAGGSRQTTGKRSLQDSINSVKQPRKSLLFRNDDMHSLLSLLHTNEFAGEVDLEHHSRFMNEPKLMSSGPAKASKKIMMRSSVKSDTHLLSMKDSNRNASMVPAWAQ
jgi:hypothetical protein